MEGTRVDRWLDRGLSKATRPRQAAALIAVVTTVITVAAGLLMTVVDHPSFPSVGLGLWWAVQTVTTVGYGDYVPHNVVGRVVATLVMLGGIGFVTVITAAITSGFVARAVRNGLIDNTRPRQRTSFKRSSRVSVGSRKTGATAPEQSRNCLRRRDDRT